MPFAAPSAPAPVVIAIDPHGGPGTAVAVDDRLHPLAAIRVEVNRGGYRQLRRPLAARDLGGRRRHRSRRHAYRPSERRRCRRGRRAREARSPRAGCCPPGAAARPTRPTPSRSELPGTPLLDSTPPWSMRPLPPCGASPNTAMTSSAAAPGPSTGCMRAPHLAVVRPVSQAPAISPARPLQTPRLT